MPDPTPKPKRAPAQTPLPADLPPKSSPTSTPSDLPLPRHRPGEPLMYDLPPHASVHFPSDLSSDHEIR